MNRFFCLLSAALAVFIGLLANGQPWAWVPCAWCAFMAGGFSERTKKSA